MAKENEADGHRPTGLQIVTTIGLGVTSLILYLLLFRYERELLDLSGRGGWSFIIPITIAFVFSFVHGIFTSNFWDVLGVKARK
ncbi:MAG: hypothetical protein FD153_2084 [Rhodospirillaceae bacterium]|nr:MAG: hypothetical protein FD153_2084 [Rhodospirillaceae bacterium]